MCIENRKQGWLTKLVHRAIREALLHTLARFRLICQAYCLMPDHGHFLFGGLSDDSDQLLAIRFFRTEWNRILSKLNSPFALQKQCHDHVLTEEERERDSFQTVAHYILANPERTELAEDIDVYPFLGALALGYPDLDPREDEYWAKF